MQRRRLLRDREGQHQDSTLDSLTAEDLARTVLIRSEPHTVVQAINRGVTHAAYHVGQIVLLAKHFAAADWQTLSIPRGKSQQFTETLHRKPSGG